MAIKIYHNPRCSKSRKALEVLDESMHDIEVINYLQEGVSDEVLRMGIEQLGFEKFIRTGKKLIKRISKEQELDDTQLVKVLKDHPILMQRPLLVKEDGTCMLGRDTAEVEELVKK